MEVGALWNAFVLVGKAEKLWELGWNYLPKMMPFFERLCDAIGSDSEREVIRSINKNMPILNFSSDLLQRAADHVAVVKLEDIFWSDWGSPERIVHSLDRIHSQSALASMQLAIPNSDGRMIPEKQELCAERDHPLPLVPWPVSP
jgi:hypothetical protein